MIETFRARAEAAARINPVVMALRGGGVEWLRSYAEDVPELIKEIERLRNAQSTDNSKELRAALEECEPQLSLLRYRGPSSIREEEIDHAITSARKALGW